MRNIVYLLIGIFLSSQIYAYESNSNGSIKDKLKAINAKMKYKKEDYKTALRLYRDLYASQSDNATINYRIGQCHLSLGNVNEALKYFEKAYNLDNFVDGINLALGTAYHLKGDLNKAVEEYNKYKSTLSAGKLKKDNVTEYLEQCAYAQTIMSSPIDVKIINLGKDINSEYPDYSPSISLDGKTFIFTSRRSDTKGKGRDNYDYGFYEDIYISEYNEDEKKWNTAKGIKGRLNTEFHDASMSISPDGTQIFVYKNVPNKTQSGDIYVSTKGSTGKWTKPKPLQKKTINTSYFESSACLSADGNTLYFVSERKKGYGKGDIYRSTKTGKNNWSIPENLGPMINTTQDEIGVFIHPDGKTLFFSSKGHKGMGGYDIYRSVLENETWSQPENLGYPVNTTGDDVHFVMTTDNKTGYYSSLKSDGYGEKDIYQINFEKFDIVKGEPVKKISNPLTIIRGKVTDSQILQGAKGKVYLIDIKDNKMAGSTTTDENGSYFIIMPGNKNYEIGFKSEKYITKTEKILVPASKNTTLTFTKDLVVDRKEKLIFAKPELFQVQNILFKLASSQLEISDDSKKQLDAVIKQLETAPSFIMQVHGHTDDMGKEKYNKELSLKRAGFIADYIKSKGIGSEKVIVEGYGSDRPISSNATEKGRSENRRVEVKLVEN